MATCGVDSCLAGASASDNRRAVVEEAQDPPFVQVAVTLCAWLSEFFIPVPAAAQNPEPGATA